MKLIPLFDTLYESPLPDGFDEEIFQNVGRNSNFAETLRYAKSRLKRIGGGSARVAFEFKYKGRNTILKLARNSKGLAQNNEESQLFGDWFVKSSDITIPMIDYDDVSSKPVWLHVEKAEKMTKSKFKKFFEFDIDQFPVILSAMRGDIPKIGSLKILYDKFIQIQEDESNDNLIGLEQLISNYTDIHIGDLPRVANWGIYKGKPVIIDLGLSKTVYEDLYDRR